MVRTTCSVSGFTLVKALTTTMRLPLLSYSVSSIRAWVSRSGLVSVSSTPYTLLRSGGEIPGAGYRFGFVLSAPLSRCFPSVMASAADFPRASAPIFESPPG